MKRRIAWAVVGLLAVWALAWVAVPPLLKSQIEAKGSEALGRKLTIGAIDFKPWSLELTASDIAIASADGSAAQFKAARVYVDAEAQSIFRLAPVVDALTIDAPQLQVTHLGEGRYDFDDIVSRFNTPTGKSAGSPLRFALHNLVLSNGELDVSDRATGGERKHTLRKLNVALPFLSNLDSQRDVTVSPRLAFELNGSNFDSAVQGTPFAQSRKGEATLKIAGFDVAPYLPYLPVGLPLQLKAAVLDTDLKIVFAQAPKVAVTVTGSATVSQLRLADATGKDFLAVDSVVAVLADVRPLEQQVTLESLDIFAPSLIASRNRAGALSPEFVANPASAVAPKKIAASASDTGAAGKNGNGNGNGAAAGAASAPAAPGGWQVQLKRFALHQGSVAWSDESTTPKAHNTLSDIALQAQGIQWPFNGKAATFEGSLAAPLQGKPPLLKAEPARLTFKGEGSDTNGKAHLTLSDLALGAAAPYVAQFLVPQLTGVLESELDVQWKDGAVQLDLQRATLRDFAMLADKAQGVAVQQSMPKIRALEIANAQVDLAARTVRIGKLAVRAPRVVVQRDEQGQWMADRWLKAGPAVVTGSTKPAEPAKLTESAQAPWKVALADFSLDDATLGWEDRVPSKPVTAEFIGLKIQAKNLTLDGNKPAPLSLSARVKAGQTEPGSIKYNGTVMWAPVTVQGNLEALQLPAHAFAPYFADKLNLELLRADASVKGAVRFAATPAGPEVQLRVDTALEEFRSNSVAGTAAQGLSVGEELLQWKALNVPGIDVAVVPGKATVVQVREASLTDFYARVLVSPEGRLNLQDLLKAQTAPAKDLMQTASAIPTALDPIITVGPVTLVQGRVLFSDRFIKPNYSADLTELTGKLSKFSSQATDGAVQMGDLELRGRAEGSASLEITGKLNPLAKPLALDIFGKVRDLELPPLSPYSIKYAGYGIDRGKLSVDVHYLVKPDGQLTATNSLVLNQLSFGDKVEGAPNSLPVKLAVALLADRNGVIDLNLPISGSLNDPQFSVGPIIWKVVVNLVTKALTAPFSLLANAFGGGDELSTVVFAPGSSVLTADARAGLDKVAKALSERTGLKVTVAGTASLEAERDALKRERLNGLLLAEKRRRAVVAGQDTSAVIAFTAVEAPNLLKEVYKRSDITKPRNLVGLAKDLPDKDMEALLLANATVNEDSVGALALSRGVAVRDYLASRQIPTDRLFLGAAKTETPTASWKPRADLSLAGR